MPNTKATSTTDHDLLVVTSTKLTDTDRRVDTVESKLDRIERKVYWLMGAAALVQAALKVWLNTRAVN